MWEETETFKDEEAQAQEEAQEDAPQEKEVIGAKSENQLMINGARLILWTNSSSQGFHLAYTQLSP